ncbi:MAG: group III truncated hemoglobin [Proteobacteria bacterium]|nr:group III truncated hemoglobin [Pseudomonadota bacterium]
MLQRPRPEAPGVAAGIDEELIGTLVDRFYAAVRRDEILGPVFESRIADWDAHLAKLRDFWSSVVLMTGRYKGRPMPVHAAIAEITDAHFERWLALFAETARAVCPPAAAALFIDRSRRIAESLKMGIALSRGDASVLGPGPISLGSSQIKPAE